MYLNGCLTLIIIFILTIGLVFRQLAEWRSRASESTSRTANESGEDNVAFRWDSESTSTSAGAVSVLGGRAPRHLRRHSESTSRTDHGSGEDNEAFDSVGIAYESSVGTDQMKGKKSSEAIQSMETEPAYQYDVFLSFCGDDTRLTFTDCLYHRMKDLGIRVFLDSEELKLGKSIKEVLKAVDESQIFIPIFTRKFASRSWCLRELARMVDRHSESKGKREIFPIFYDVKTKDVKLKTDLYENDILEHKEHFQSSELDRWRSALRKVGGLIGSKLEGMRQGKEIESIVKEVLCKLNGKHVDLPEELVEDHRQIKVIIEKLDLNFGGVRFVGIHGTGGIGKTTLAKVLFKKLVSRFDRVCFLNDVRKSTEHGLDGLLTLQKKLLTSVGSSLQADLVQDIGDGMRWIKAVCCQKKVLIVLDDLDNNEQLAKLAGNSDWFGSGSRIIITTRNESILMTQVESSRGRNQPEGILCYPVREMAFDQALQLFYKHALRSSSPTKDYDALSSNIVIKVARLPLAIEVIGSYLYGLGFSREPHDDKIKLLEETLEELDEGPFEGVRKVLMISYRGLTVQQREVFLDIACLFANEDQTYPVIMWDDCGYRPYSAIRVLRQWSLIKIRENKFWMHDQVRDLGRYIALKEYPSKENPFKFSRVWTHKDAEELLDRTERNEHVQAVSLTSGGSIHNFAADKLVALPKLRFLRAKGLDISGDFENLLSMLRWLSWQTCRTTFQATNFHFGRLIVLNLSDSNIEDGWDGWSQMKMDKLKVLDLTGCMGLTRTPDLSNFMSLEMLVLAWCVNLTTIDGSLGKLKFLETFNINGCMVLCGLPPEFGSLQSLKEIIMPQNYQQFELPETFGNLQSLSSLILDEHPGINELPHSIGKLKVQRLSLCGCAGIRKLPSSFGEMKMLTELDLSKSGIEELHHSIGYLKELKVIRISYTRISKLPHTIGQLKMLEELHAKKCWQLTDENLEQIKGLTKLRILDISYTGVSRFPTVLGHLSRLETLEMSSSNRQGVPDLPSSLTHLHMQAPHFSSMSKLSGLVNLDYLELSILTGTTKMPNVAWTHDSQEAHLLPSSLSTLTFRGINLLPAFSNFRNLSEMSIIEHPMSCFSISQELTHLRTLKLRKCQALKEIRGLAVLTNLWYLDLNGLENLVKIHGLLELKSLEHFRIAHCLKVKRLSGLSKLDKLRYIEIEACPNIRKIKGFQGIESLELDNRGCLVLERLLDDPGSQWIPHRIPTYDVFLSFRGKDTRYSMVPILYKNLLRTNILVYRDDEAVPHGEGISRELQAALDDSRIYIPFLSKGYASSNWCLRELACMVECKKSDEKRRILPIYYDVEKADVKLESNLYNDALEYHRSIYDSDKVDEWEKALRYIGDMEGYDPKTNGHGKVIDLVTEEVSRVLLDAYVRRHPAVED